MAIRVFGLAGSLRSGSYNRALLAAATGLAPADMEIRAFDRLAEIPLYDDDVETRGEPEPVLTLKAAMREADALLFVTPEYNHSIPGVLKNAIDWASRPAADPAFGGKPVGILGATPGLGGTIRAQLALRQTLSAATHLMSRPEVFVAHAADKFDAAGRLTDATTRGHVERYLAALAVWTRRLDSR